MQATRAHGPVALTIDDHDRMRWLTYLTVGGVVVAGVLALIGGFPLDVPMPTHRWGFVEPTCGLTRGSTAIARGDFALAFRYNPASFLVMGVGMVGIARAVVGTVTHRWANLSILRLPWYTWVVLAVAFVALGLYQNTNAEFIMHSRA